VCVCVCVSVCVYNPTPPREGEAHAERPQFQRHPQVSGWTSLTFNLQALVHQVASYLNIMTMHMIYYIYYILCVCFLHNYKWKLLFLNLFYTLRPSFTGCSRLLNISFSILHSYPHADIITRIFSNIKLSLKFTRRQSGPTASQGLCDKWRRADNVGNILWTLSVSTSFSFPISVCHII